MSSVPRLYCSRLVVSGASIMARRTFRPPAALGGAVSVERSCTPFASMLRACHPAEAQLTNPKAIPESLRRIDPGFDECNEVFKSCQALFHLLGHVVHDG